MEKSKWMAMVASIWIQCSGGASYTFGIYSAVLKSSQGYDQSTLDTVSVFKDIGANIGILSGFLYDAVTSGSIPSSSRFGSRLSVVYLTGAVQCLIGYFLVWLSVTEHIQRPHVLLMCFFMFMASHAQTFFNTANVVVSVQNFPDYGGTTVGIMKGFLGLSGAILIQIYLTLFDGKPTYFLLMLALLPTFLSLGLMCWVHENPSNTTHDKHYINKFSVIAVVIATYLGFILFFENIFVFPTWAHFLTTIILLIILFSLPYKIALMADNSEEQVATSTSPTMTTPLIAASKSQKDAPVVEMNLLQAMKTLNFWLLFLAMVCAMGSGLATINNLTQIAESLKYSTVEINTMLSLWSIWNFLGRFGGGFVSDYFLHTHGWGRPLFISLTLAAMIVGHLSIALGWTLYIGTFIIGVCYGSQWSLMPTITSEIFGVKNMATIFNTIAAANPVGSYIFSVKVIGRFYDKESGERGTCEGVHCFMHSFLVLGVVCGIGFGVSLGLFFLTKEVYAAILERRSNRVEVEGGQGGEEESGSGVVVV